MRKEAGCTELVHYTLGYYRPRWTPSNHEIEIEHSSYEIFYAHAK